MSERAMEPERGAEYSVEDDGSITYYNDDPSPELRERAEAEAAQIRQDRDAATSVEQMEAGEEARARAAALTGEQDAAATSGDDDEQEDSRDA